jgi:hypothetical protein
MEASSLRHALAVVAHTLNTRSDWLAVQTLREQIAQALIHAEKAMLGVVSDDDELAHAAVRLLLALEQRERERIAVETLRASVAEKRAR